MARLQTAALTLLLLLLVAVAPLDAAAPAARGGRELHFKWDVGYLFWNPDCGGERVMIGINGQFPGPTIRAKAGDTVVVELKNGLHTEGVVIHWHGISQRGTPWADGTASISQCAINPEETFTYRFIVDRPGTYFYHGHLGMQRAAGLYGSLIVDVADGQKEPFHYDGEFDLLLSDWYHKDIFSQMVGLSSNPFRWVGEPQSILINGRGQFNCSLASAQLGGGGLGGVPGPIGACSISSPQCQPVTLPVRPNKTYRIRLASTTSLASLNVAVGNHKLVVVEADGNYVQPFTVDNLDVYSGESYSVLLTTSSPASKFSKHWLSVAVRGRKPATPPALAVVNYLQTRTSKVATSPPPVHPVWNDFAASKKFTYQILALPGTPKPPASADRRIVLLNTQNNINGGFIKWAINNVSLVLPPTPYLGALKHGVRHAFDAALPPDTFPPNYDVTRPPPNTNTSVGNGLYMLKFNSTVDVVLQNANALAVNVSEVHPWHLHGHDFWVLGYGEGKFDAAKDVAKFNLKNPPLRNTVVIFPYGWTALRFVADNPGVWAFHCHIEPHLHMGMGVVVAEGVDLVSSIPQEALACGLTAKKLMRGGHHGHRH